MILKSRLILIVCLLFVGFSCSDENESPQVQRTTVIKSVSLAVRTAAELRNYIALAGWDVDETLIKYDVEIFEVTYRTTYQDEEVQASGIVMVPKTTDALSLISFQHGTISADSEAPTSQSTIGANIILTSALASTGLVTVFPDYLGFGASADIFHPYYIEEATALPIVDNIRAAKEIADKMNANLTGKLFLAGYSQGGYATMATHKYIEENGNPEGLTLIASFPAAGGYDVKNMQEYFFQQDTYDQPFYIAYVARAYEVYYGWDNAVNDFFTDPYEDRIPTLFNGVNTASTINGQLTSDIDALLEADLLLNIDSDPKYSYIVDAFTQNSLTDWVPTIPLHMYHGDADVTVPYENSVHVYNTFISNGASTEVVTFTTLPGGTHSSGLQPYVENFLAKLQELL